MNQFQNLKGLATEKQLAALKRMRIPFEDSITKQEASDIITTCIDDSSRGFPSVLCNKCKKLVQNLKIVSKDVIEVTCCGYKEKFTKNPKKVKTRIIGNTDGQGRLHGAQPTFGTATEIRQHGIQMYLDDGNGNVYDFEQELDDYD